MAANYEQFKQAWNQMGNAERRQYTEQYKNDSNFQQFAQQYSNEMKGTTSTSSSSNQNNSNAGVVNNTTGTNNGSNSNNGNGTNGSYDPIYYRNEENNSDSSNSSDNSNGDRKYYENNGYSSDGKNGDGGFYGKTTFDKEETLDKSMFNEAPGKITIEAGTGKETGRPDYEVWDAARETEMKKNLDEYYATMPHLFRDRDTFNKFFEYNKRESDAQRELLDSYWKKAQNDKAANTYTNSDQLKLGFSNGDVTPDILDAIKFNNPDLYAQWEKAMQDDLNARIANYAVPRTATQTADIWMDLVKRLGIEAGDPYQIYDNWVGRCEELGVFNMNNQLSQYISEMESVKNERTRAMQRTMSQGAGRKSQALIDAEVSKTSSLYDARFADLQNMYQATYNQRQQNLAIANQSAQMLQAQAQEDQRIFNNKITALGFAMKVDDYRTPEQQLQNQLRFNAINNDLNLLNKAKSNDLELYNKYATAKLENQLNYEMQDLTVTDPKQLRANLSNVLDQWYEQYGDIIERPKSQVIEDVIAYAKANNMPVGEALRKNFIEPLMSKQEYKNSIASKYPEPENKYQTKWKQSVDKDGNITWTAEGYGELQDMFKNIANRKGVQNAMEELSNSVGDAESFIAGLKQLYPEGAYGGQCGAFVNDVLSKGFGDSTHLGNDFLTEKLVYRNKGADEKPKAGDVYLMSSKTNSNGHTGMIVGVGQNGDVTIMDSNGNLDNPETVRYKTYSAGEWEQLCTQGIGGYKVEGYYESPAVQYSNQMSAAFKNATENANGKTADERTNLANAKRIYDMFSEMKDNGQMRDVIMGSFGQDLFSNLVTQTFSDEKGTGSSFASALATTLERDYERGLIDDSTKAAITNFARAIEIKLRIESGAAISASEWQSNFLNYMPGQGKGLEADVAAMRAWDDLLSSWTSPHLTDGYKYKHMFDRDYIWGITNGYNGMSNLDISDNNIPTGAKKKDTTTWYGDAAINTAVSMYFPAYGLVNTLYNYFK